jgi:hypothetical protein
LFLTHDSIVLCALQEKQEAQTAFVATHTEREELMQQGVDAIKTQLREKEARVGEIDSIVVNAGERKQELTRLLNENASKMQEANLDRLEVGTFNHNVL